MSHGTPQHLLGPLRSHAGSPHRGVSTAPQNSPYSDPLRSSGTASHFATHAPAFIQFPTTEYGAASTNSLMPNGTSFDNGIVAPSSASTGGHFGYNVSGEAPAYSSDPDPQDSFLDDINIPAVVIENRSLKRRVADLEGQMEAYDSTIARIASLLGKVIADQTAKRRRLAGVSVNSGVSSNTAINITDDSDIEIVSTSGRAYVEGVFFREAEWTQFQKDRASKAEVSVAPIAKEKVELNEKLHFLVNSDGSLTRNSPAMRRWFFRKLDGYHTAGKISKTDTFTSISFDVREELMRNARKDWVEFELAEYDWKFRRFAIVNMPNWHAGPAGERSKQAQKRKKTSGASTAPSPSSTATSPSCSSNAAATAFQNTDNTASFDPAAGAVSNVSSTGTSSEHLVSPSREAPSTTPNTSTNPGSSSPSGRSTTIEPTLTSTNFNTDTSRPSMNTPPAAPSPAITAIPVEFTSSLAGITFNTATPAASVLSLAQAANMMRTNTNPGGGVSVMDTSDKPKMAKKDYALERRIALDSECNTMKRAESWWNKVLTQDARNAYRVKTLEDITTWLARPETPVSDAKAFDTWWKKLSQAQKDTHRSEIFKSTT